jgi:hypothetical protein
MEPSSTGQGLPSVSSAEIEALMNKIKDLESKVNEKVDCDTFDNEIASIRDMIGNMEPSDENKQQAIVTTVVTSPPKERGPQISSKDLNRIKEVLDKFPGVEDALSRITK